MSWVCGRACMLMTFASLCSFLAGVMADLLKPYVEVNKQLLRCDDESAKELKLMQQFFR